MKKIFLFASMVLCSTLLLAQNKVTVTGTVTATDDGLGVPAANVMIKGTTTGTFTDDEGRYTLANVPENAVLVFSSIGYTTTELAVNGKTVVNVLISPDSEFLDETIVVAYGTQSRATITGAIQQVKSAEIEKRPTTTVTAALEGTVAGVQVYNTVGVPGADGEPSIRIRGVGTVNGSTSPFYVLDGVPFSGNISDLNPVDIESISVLKDAASAALYGNRAANGVILITTKKGQAGRVNVSLDIKQGSYNRAIKEYDHVNANEFMEVSWKNLRNYQISANGLSVDEANAYASANLISDMLYLNIYNVANDDLFTSIGGLNPNATMLSGYVDDLDWTDQSTRKGYRQEYNFSANGATENADYLMSVGYLDENGFCLRSGYNRIVARTAVNLKATKWLKVGVNLTGSHQNTNNLTSYDSSSAYANPYYYCRYMSPIYPVHLHDVNTGEYILDANGNKQYDLGSYTDEATGITYSTRNQNVDRHVIYEHELNSDKTIRNTLNGIAYADIYLPYDFTLTIKGNLSVRNSENQAYNSAIVGDGKGNNGRGKRVDYRYKNYTFQQQLNWTHDFGPHHVDALLGHENYDYTYNYLYGYKTNQTFEGQTNLDNFNEITSLYDYNMAYRTESYLARARYSYEGKYNAEVSFRRDGSSRFSKDARWGNFWSIGANWVISSEDFMRDVRWVDFLKLRADYGEVGSDAGASYYGFMALYTSSQNANQGAYWITQLPNYDLKWETGQSWGVAVEGRLFNRWNITLEYFNRRNKDLLFDVYQPLSAGATSTGDAESVVTQNLGVIANTGFEITTDFDVVRSGDWTVNVGLYGTFLKNKVVKLPEQNKDGIVSGTKKIVEGKDRYAFYTYTWVGIDTYNGYSLYKFNDEDYYFTADGTTYGNSDTGSEIEEIDGTVVVIDGVPYTYNTTYGKREFHGSALPKFYGSLSLNIQWKQFSVSALFTTQLGAKVLDYSYQSLMSQGSSPHAFHKDILKSWDVDDATSSHGINASGIPVIDYNRSSYNNATSSRFLISGNYLVLKNLSFTYQLPENFVQKLNMQGIGLSVSWENLFTLTKRKGMNPQQSYSGTSDDYIGSARVFSAGLSFKF